MLARDFEIAAAEAFMSQTGSKKDRRRFAQPVASFAGRAVLFKRPVWIAGLLAHGSTEHAPRNQSGPTHYLKLASLACGIDDRRQIFLNYRPAYRQPGDHPVYVANPSIRMERGDDRHIVRVSVPLYPEVGPAVEFWPLDLVAPMSLYQANILDLRPPLPVAAP